MKDACARCNRPLFQDETIRLTKEGKMFHMNCVHEEPIKVVWKYDQEFANQIPGTHKRLKEMLEPMLEASIRVLKSKGLIKQEEGE